MENYCFRTQSYSFLLGNRTLKYAVRRHLMSVHPALLMPRRCIAKKQCQGTITKWIKYALDTGARIKPWGTARFYDDFLHKRCLLPRKNHSDGLLDNERAISFENYSHILAANQRRTYILKYNMIHIILHHTMHTLCKLIEMYCIIGKYFLRSSSNAIYPNQGFVPMYRCCFHSCVEVRQPSGGFISMLELNSCEI